jgi:hypothetical protein
VTSGLRKVTDDMKTKNRADRSGHVTATPAAAAAAAAAPKAAAKPAAGTRGPPRCASYCYVHTMMCLHRILLHAPQLLDDGSWHATRCRSCRQMFN